MIQLIIALLILWNNAVPIGYRAELNVHTWNDASDRKVTLVNACYNVRASEDNCIYIEFGQGWQG